MGGDTFRLSLEHTTSELADLDQTVRTPWFAVRDAETARRLEFRVEVHAGGFFGALEGRTRAGGWPMTWRAEPMDLQRVPVLQLPERDEHAVARLARWLEQDEALLGRAEAAARHPAAAAALATLAESEPALPEQLLDFLSVTDGLQVGPVEMLGAQDVYTVDVFGSEVPPLSNRRVLRRSGRAVDLSLHG